jgi:CysZ protein
MWMLWFPLIITGLVVYGGFELTSTATDYVTAELKVFIDSNDWFGDWKGVIGTILYWVLWLILRIALYFILAFVGGSVILLLMTPVLTYCSERVSAAIGNQIPEFRLSQFLNDMSRAILLSLTNGVIQAALTLICFILCFIPVIGIASPFLMIIIGAYFYGANFLDYSPERMQIGRGESQRFVWRNRSKSIGLGLPFALWMLIPFFGPLTAGFTALLATVSATLTLKSVPSEPTRIDQ